MVPVCLHACRCRLQFHLLLYSVQKGHRIGAAALKIGFRRTFHKFHLQRRAGDLRKDGAGRHLFDLLSLSLKGHPCGEPCPVKHGLETLEASVQLRHIRPGHCLKCFVTSSTTDFIRTEQGLHYNNIFVRNGSGGYLQLDACSLSILP